MELQLSDITAAAMRADQNRNLARAHIEAAYPVYRQLNILRAGSDEDKVKMGAFIDAVRNWSNGEAPSTAALEAIRP